MSDIFVATASSLQKSNQAYIFPSVLTQDFKESANNVLGSLHSFDSEFFSRSTSATNSDSSAVTNILKSLKERGVQISDCEFLCDYLEDRLNLASALELICEEFLSSSNIESIQISIYSDEYDDDEYIQVLIDERKRSDSFFETVERVYGMIQDCLRDSDGWIQIERSLTRRC
jgi:hypothetical protein